MTPWVLHDLHRSVADEPGRAIPGVDGLYDGHSYDSEKAHAVLQLADLVDKIINPPSGNVIDLQSRKGSDA
jgi:hypothetical protein